MTRRITVWTPVTDENVASAIALLRHLDAQTLRVGEWELVLAAPTGTDVSALESPPRAGRTSGSSSGTRTRPSRTATGCSTSRPTTGWRPPP